MTKTLEVGELLIVLMLVVACHVTKKTNSSTLSSFDKAGRRTTRITAPENTIRLTHGAPYSRAKAEGQGR